MFPQTVRVFVSSTFRDMRAEREHLVKVVLPALREKLEKHRVPLVDIDLRWTLSDCGIGNADCRLRNEWCPTAVRQR